MNNLEGNRMGLYLIPLVLFVPFFNFLSANLHLQRVDFFSPLAFTIVMLIVAIGSAFVISSFTKYKYVKISLSITFLYILLFNYELLYAVILKTPLVKYLSIINIVGLLIISTLFALFLFFSKYKAFVNAYIFFISVVFFISGSILITSYVSYKSQENIEINNVKKILKNSVIYSGDKPNFTKNIYYIIADGLGSERGLKYGGVSTGSLKQLKTTLQNKDFNFVKSTSSYNTTYLSIQSIFNMDYPITIDSDIYHDRRNFFPASVSMLNKQEPILKRTLLSLGYKRLYWFGNIWGRCTESSNLDCPISKHKDSFLYKNMLDFLQNNSLIVYLENSIYPRVAYRLIRLFFPTKSNNNPIDNLISYIEKNKGEDDGNFFFVHQLTPHPPYVTENCNPIFGTGKESWNEPEYKGYYNSSIRCLNSKIEKLIGLIDKYDKDAIIVIQGDHGSDFKDNSHNFKELQEDYFIERFSNFSAFRVSDVCNKYLYDNIGTVNSIRLAVSCAVGIKPDFVDDKNFYAGYEVHDFFGRVVDVTDKVRY